MSAYDYLELLFAKCVNLKDFSIYILLYALMSLRFSLPLCVFSLNFVRQYCGGVLLQIAVTVCVCSEITQVAQ